MHTLTVDNLSLSAGKNKILENISFASSGGEITLVAGKNGSGKSMLLKTIKGLCRESSGSISLDSEKLSSKERMRKIALCFQDSMLQTVGRTVKKDIQFGLENLNLRKEEIDRRLETTIKEFSLSPVADKDPVILSGGERKKAAIAAVIAMDEDVILLDEPLGNLDWPSAVTVINTLEMLKKRGKNIIIVSHEAEKLLAITDRCVVLADGKSVYTGSSESAIPYLRTNGVFVPDVPFSMLRWN